MRKLMFYFSAEKFSVLSFQIAVILATSGNMSLAVYKHIRKCHDVYSLSAWCLKSMAQDEIFQHSWAQLSSQMLFLRNAIHELRTCLCLIFHVAEVSELHQRKKYSVVTWATEHWSLCRWMSCCTGWYRWQDYPFFHVDKHASKQACSIKTVRWRTEIRNGMKLGEHE
jgi:hypothetical protein